MKNHKILLLLPALLAMQTAFAQSSHLTLSDNYPAAAEKIKLKYDTVGTPLGGKKDISAQVYFLDGKENPAADVTLKQQGAVLTGDFTVPATAKAFFVKVFSGDDVDSNNENGYIFYVYKDQKPVPNAYEAKAYILASGVGTNLAKIKTVTDPAFDLFKQEEEVYPQGEKLYRLNYYYMLSSKKDAATVAMFDNKVRALAKSDNEKDLVLAINMLAWRKNKKDADSLLAVIKTRFPKGESAQSDDEMAIYRESDLGKKDSLYKALIVKYPALANDKSSLLDYVRVQIASGFLEKGNTAAFNTYLPLIKNKSTLAYNFNNAAYELAKKGESLDVAENMSKQSLDIVSENIKKPVGAAFSSPKSSAKNSQSAYDTYADTYAFILYKQKKYAEAYKYAKPLFPRFKDEAETAEHYVLILNALGKYADAKPITEDLIKAGKESPVLVDELKKTYVGTNGNETGYEPYLANLMQISKAKKREELTKQMINEPAVAFALKDFDGNSVSLEGLKGKTVIVDFWATWCGPCKASFPGMQLAVNKYKDDPEVKFLFVDTWENGDNFADGVKKFIADNKYTFHVLFDEKGTDGRQSKVVSQFGVTGIPTKFILDKNGNIRFKVVGYSGSTNGVFNEVSTMIDLLKDPTATTAVAATEGKK
ncbi:Thiol-disulfide isomerase or thioredoxin [Mucilaginibacter pineti]|uniref:Thiol-disulfide isomerase or thioredoxin n=1 Tax=Mucilaginibacter pineti TaxID=1391627 RepID=A0A1G6XMG0_9SPHI|nr:TlpA disulfide reductase family protein [Mucilaginibacter pineti]SDD78605.1 Thiol-disulfide isomerase or thioredoxin [Mucilaginibacter pineti]